MARGMRVLELFTREYQIEENRLSVSGDGSNRPAGPNETPEGRALNRRVEVVILDEPQRDAPAEQSGRGREGPHEFRPDCRLME